MHWIFYIADAPIIFSKGNLGKKFIVKIKPNLQYANLFGSNSIFSKELIIKKGGHGPKGPSFNSLSF